MPELPKIKKLSEIGETPFQVVKVEEKILQGWDKAKRKMLYLFKGPTGLWSYYDKAEKCIVEVPQWKDKAALIQDSWVDMSVYYRVHLRFERPIAYTSYEGSRPAQATASEALVTITGAAYESMEEQFRGRPEGSFYQFSYKKLKNNRQYVDKVIFVR